MFKRVFLVFGLLLRGFQLLWLIRNPTYETDCFSMNHPLYAESTYSQEELGLYGDTQTNSCDVDTGLSHDRCHHIQVLDTLYPFYLSVENLQTQCNLI